MKKVIFQSIGDFEGFLYLISDLGKFFTKKLLPYNIAISDKAMDNMLREARSLIISAMPHEIIREKSKIDDKTQINLSCTVIKKNILRAERNLFLARDELRTLLEEDNR